MFKAKFYEAHKFEIDEYINAKNYIADNSPNGKNEPDKWRTEARELEHSMLLEGSEISQLEDDVVIMETVKANVKFLDEIDRRKEREKSKRLSAEL